MKKVRGIGKNSYPTEQEKRSLNQALEYFQMPNNNIFRQAQVLLQQKPVSEMNEEELHIVNAATIPLNTLPQFNDMTIEEGLEELAKMADECQYNDV